MFYLNSFICYIVYIVFSLFLYSVTDLLREMHHGLKKKKAFLAAAQRFAPGDIIIISD